jgi:hypothetical protein
MGHPKDIAGKKFGRLLAISQEVERSASGSVMWKCACDCGNTSVISGSSLRSGNSKSCGCAKYGHTVKHGHSRVGKVSSEYSIWVSMKQRCENPNNKNYASYGGRGITVCDRWNSFENFASDMGSRPSTKHSVDRIDNDGPYSPWNCRWATSKTQGANMRNNLIVTLDGETMCLAEAVNKRGQNYYVVYSRMRRCGWTLERALNTPTKGQTE